MGDSSEDFCKRHEIILTYTRHHWRNRNEQELETSTSHEQKKDEISSMVAENGEANVFTDVQVNRDHLISSAASTSLGCQMVKATTPKIDIDVKSSGVPAPATPDIVTRKHRKRMMSPGKCEPPEDVSQEPWLAKYGKASVLEIEPPDSKKKTCRRSFSLDMRNLKRKAQNDLVLDEIDVSCTTTCIDIDGNSVSKASVVLSQVQEHDPKMNEKVRDAKDFGSPRSVLVYYRRKLVKNQVQKETIKSTYNRFICCTSLPNELKASNTEQSMNKSDSECNKEFDEEDSDCQKSEKESLHRQINIFISCMRHVQGERKFSQWKGSVMDSIGGAYIAQNVNDVLSSTAFMSLAAKFPREAVRASSPVEASTSKMRNDYVVLNVKEKKRNSASSKNLQKEKSAEKDRCSKTRNSRRQRKKRKQDRVLLNVLKDCHSKYYSEKNTPEMSEAIDWDSVRMAKVDDISKAIQIRGMNNNLAERIKNCLKELVKNFGSTDMEWIRDVPSHKAKEYLLSIYGLGLKSVECIRLLTLRQKAFPIDRNAGRVAVRLGWVPLRQLPEGEEFHLLKEYPKLNSIQMYLWQHLSDYDFPIHYELHCQMITFGKIFCTERNPNCYRCPMKKECKYFASVQASEPAPAVETDIEDYGRIENPVTRFHEERLKEHMQISMSKKNMPLKEGELSSNLLVHTSETASISVVKKKKKYVKSLSTQLKVYVLPDHHELLAELESGELNDSCPYLLAVWTRDAIYSGSESLAKDEHIPEEDSVYGTLLIPAWTATRGIFPLNGTFFQANEVFADDESSEVPIKIPMASLMNLSSKTLYCGKSMSTICRGMTSVEVRECFKTGFTCFRGFNKKTREPKPLPARFHPRSMKKN